jgi:hypothetical protein
MTAPDLHTPEAHDVIACELTACVLGQRRRPELRADVTGVLARFVQGMARAFDDFLGSISPETRRMLAAAAAAQRAREHQERERAER